MAIIDREFQDLLVKILTEGREYDNVKRGVKRLQIPSYTFRHRHAGVLDTKYIVIVNEGGCANVISK